MDWMQFMVEMAKAAAEVIKAVAWPAVVLAVFTGLREPLLERFKYLRRLVWGDKSAEFADGLEQLVIAQSAPARTTEQTPMLPEPTQPPAVANAPPVPAPPPVAFTPEYHERFLRGRASANPQAGVLMAWDTLHTAIFISWVSQHPLRKVDADWPSSQLLADASGVKMAGGLLLHGRLTAEDYDAVVKLHDLYKLADSGRVEVTKEQAMEFVDIATRIMRKLIKFETVKPARNSS